MNAQPQRSRSIPYLKLMGSFFLLLGHIALCAFLCPMAGAAQGQAEIMMIAHDVAGQPVGKVEVRLKRNGADVRAGVTDDKGKFVFHCIGAGEYELTVSKDGFEPLAQSVSCDSTATTAEIEFTMIPKLERVEKVEGQETASVEGEQTSSTATTLNPKDVKLLPSRPSTDTDTLPPVPGVVRGPDVELKIEGTGEHRTDLVLNSIDVTDPT